MAKMLGLTRKVGARAALQLAELAATELAPRLRPVRLSGLARLTPLA